MKASIKYYLAVQDKPAIWITAYDRLTLPRTSYATEIMLVKLTMKIEKYQAEKKNVM